MNLEYFPYGETWVHNKATSEQTSTPYKFTGKELDEETGLYYFGARYYDPVVSQWVSTDPPMMRGDYFPTGAQLFFPEDKFDHRSLPGIGGIYNSVNLNVYHYAGQNPVKYTDPDGNTTGVLEGAGIGTSIVLGTAVGFTFKYATDPSFREAAGSFFPGMGKEIKNNIMTAILIATVAKNVMLSEDKAIGAKDKLPNQGEVTAGVKGAPNVDAGKQGKHVPGHKNEGQAKSKWREGENGVKETQEAWVDGKEIPRTREGVVREGTASDGRKIRAHQDSKGNIHGYPLK